MDSYFLSTVHLLSEVCPGIFSHLQCRFSEEKIEFTILFILSYRAGQYTWPRQSSSYHSLRSSHRKLILGVKSLGGKALNLYSHHWCRDVLHATRCSPEDLMSAVCDNRGEGGDERENCSNQGESCHSSWEVTVVTVIRVWFIVYQGKT